MNIFVFCFMFIVSSCATVSPLSISSKAGQVHEIDINEFDKVVNRKHEKITIIEVGAPWCEPCQAVKPRMVALAEEKKDIYQVGIVDVGNEISFLDKHKIFGLPAWYIYFPDRSDPIRADGSVLDKIESLAMSYPDLDKNLLDDLTSRIAKPSKKSPKK